MDDKVLYITPEELKTLLLLVGCKRIYCFELGTDTNRNALIKSLCSVKKKKWIKIEDTHISIDSDIRVYLYEISDAPYVLKLESKEFNTCMIYPSSKNVNILIYNGEMISMRSIVKQDLFLWMEEFYDLPKTYWETQNDADKDEIYTKEEDIIKSFDLLTIQRINAENGEPMDSLSFKEGLTNYWVYKSQDKMINIKPDSEECRDWIIDKWI